MKPFLDPKTAKKVNFIMVDENSSAEKRQQIVNFVPLKQLPARYGGMVEERMRRTANK